MEARKITDMQEIMKLLPIEQAIMAREPEAGKMPLRDKLLWLDCLVNKKPFAETDGGVMAWYDGDKVVGYMILSCTKSKIKYFDAIHVYRVWHDPDYDIANEVEEYLIGLAKNMKVHTIRSEANRRLRAFQRKYHMQPISVNLERKV